MGLAAFNRLRRRAQEKHEESSETPEVLFGSGTHESSYEIGDKTVQLGDLVRAAFDQSGMTLQEWNEQAEADRDARIQAALEQMQEESSEGESDEDDGSDERDAGDTADAAKEPDEAPDDKTVEQSERDKLAAEYEARFGKKPHPAMKTENIRKKLEDAEK